MPARAAVEAAEHLAADPEAVDEADRVVEAADRLAETAPGKNIA